MKVSVLIPYFNEALNILDTASRIQQALITAEISDFEILVLDDGSDDLTEILELELSTITGLRVIKVPHRCRYQTRIAGLELVRYDLVLLIASRVKLCNDSLTFLNSEYSNSIRPRNGHVIFDPDCRTWMLFWEALSRIVWSRVFSPSFDQGVIGASDFDSWPKGTGLFFAPREQLLAAMKGSQSFFSNDSLASDDTLVLSTIARDSGIIYDTSFLAYYLPRSRFRDFFSHVFERGTHAVDSFGHKLTPISVGLILVSVSPLLLFLVIPLSVSGAIQGFWLTFIVILLGYFGIGLLSKKKKLPRRHISSILMMLPLAMPVYIVGIYRGIVLAISGRLMKGQNEKG